jgi:aldose 1-epimerase
MTRAGIELRAGTARATISPDRGAAVTGLFTGDVPVLRPAGDAEEGPFAVSSIVLAPFSNRVSRPFPWRNGSVPLARNVETEAFPIHGDAFQRPWEVAELGGARAVLRLADGAFGPIRYAATLTYDLSPRGFRSHLAIVGRSDGPMPFGIGFHPWFPRDADTRLTFAAHGVWEEDARHLPTTDAPAPIPEAWDFAAGRALPEGWINNGFDGWDGALVIGQGRAGKSVAMTAHGPLSTLIVFSPDGAADFFCAEPVSHPVDAHNLPGMPGLATLAPGDELSGAMDLTWEA